LAVRNYATASYASNTSLGQFGLQLRHVPKVAIKFWPSYGRNWNLSFGPVMVTAITLIWVSPDYGYSQMCRNQFQLASKPDLKKIHVFMQVIDVDSFHKKHIW